MIRMKGSAVSGGVAMGRLWWLGAPEEAHGDAPAPEQDGPTRLAMAQRQASGELRALADQCRREGDVEAAELMETHLLLLADEDYMAAIDAAMQAGADAASAVRTAGETFAAQLAALPDPYMQARAGDVRDVTGRLLAALQGEKTQGWPEEAFILAAQDLMPSACIRLRGAPVQGIALSDGSPRGHTAILARSMGIPAAFGLGEALDASCAGREAILDGGRGTLLLEPDEQARAGFCVAQAEAADTDAAAQAVRGLPDVTGDGRRLDILCSIAAPEDCRAVLANDGGGVGLLRSELLFLTDAAAPGEERQWRAYRQVAQHMAGRRVVIRLLDMGADKQAPWLSLPQEENPALGLRGIRLCLQRPEMLRTQLRAICRASDSGNIAVLLPMVTTVEEVRACRQMLTQVQQELTREGIPFDAAMEMGVMLETPAAALTVPALATEADFFSLGTNDLTQYILACDRQSHQTGGVAQGYHPAVMAVIRQAAGAARAAGKRIGVCGEMGGDAALLPFFLDAGVCEVTVPAHVVLPLRAALRGVGGD